MKLAFPIRSGARLGRVALLGAALLTAGCEPIDLEGGSDTVALSPAAPAALGDNLPGALSLDELERERLKGAVDAWLRSYGSAALSKEGRAGLRQQLLELGDGLAEQLRARLDRQNDYQDPLVKVGAIAATPLAPTPEAIELLRRIAREDTAEENRRNALVALAAIAPAGLAEDLAVAFEDGSESVHLAAVQLAARSPHAQELLGQLHSENLLRRRGGILLAAEMGARDQLPALRAKLASPEWLEVAYAADSLRRLGDADAAPALLAALVAFPDASIVRCKIAQALPDVDPAGTQEPALRQALETETNPDVQLLMVTALGIWKHEASLPALTHTYRTAAYHPDVRCQAIVAMGQIESPEVERVLRFASLDDKSELRQSALATLCARGTIDVWQLAEALLDEGDPVRSDAVAHVAGLAKDPAAAATVATLHPLLVELSLIGALGDCPSPPAPLSSPFARGDASEVALAYLSAMQHLAARVAGFFAASTPESVNERIAMLRIDPAAQAKAYAGLTIARVESIEADSARAILSDAGGREVPLELRRDEHGNWSVIE